MTSVQEALPVWCQLLAWGLAAMVLAGSAGTSWRYVRGAGSESRRVLLLAALALAAMRWFNTAPLDGVLLHLLGATIATLLFGARVACWAMALVSLSGLLLGAAWHGWAMDFLVTGVLPVATTAWVSRTVRRWLPRNIFVYVMGNAFFAAAVAMAASILAKAAFAWWLGSRALVAYLAAMPLLMFAEAFFAGTVMVLIVVYRPQWCSSFDDRLYLWPQRPM